MNKKQAKKLFESYIKNECSPQEIELLNTYLDSFQDKTELWSELEYDDEIKEKLWSKINSKIDNEQEPNAFSFKKYLKYAAVFIVLLGGILWYKFKITEPANVSKLITDSAIILKTSDNKVNEISANQEQILFYEKGVMVSKQKGNQISYDQNDEIKELVYNEIIVPNGKKFQLILSDGTLVHLNSGSSLKYPINFILGQDRQVFLKGEAYFEVTKNAENPFLVSTDEMRIQVLGTHFNLSSYKGAQTYAVLAEGSVAVYNQKLLDGGVTIIQPGEKASITDNMTEVNKVNLNDYLWWREGGLSFNNESFTNIMQKIERHYGVSIDNKYTDLSPVSFRGRFKDETIFDLLDTFKESVGFEYNINKNKIIISNMEE